MHPPSSVCESLYRLHKWARLGWVGEDRKGPADDLNKGSFALLQLYHQLDAKETFYGDPWGDRGPVFGRSYDRLMRVPIMLTLVSNEDVFSGKIVPMLKQWMKPIAQRMLAGAKEKGEKYQDALDDLAGQQGEHLYWRSMRPNAARPMPIAQKFLTPHDKAVIAGDTIRGVKDKFVNDLLHAPGASPLR